MLSRTRETECDKFQLHYMSMYNTKQHREKFCSLKNLEWEETSMNIEAVTDLTSLVKINLDVINPIRAN